MMRNRCGRSVVLAVVAIAVSALVATGMAGANGPPWVTVSTDFESPLFGLAVAPGHRLMVADAGAGPTEVRGGSTELVAGLAGVIRRGADREGRDARGNE